MGSAVGVGQQLSELGSDKKVILREGNEYFRKDTIIEWWLNYPVP